MMLWHSVKKHHSINPPLQVASRLVVIAVLIACAVGVSKLMKISQDLSSKIDWDAAKINNQVCNFVVSVLHARMFVPCLASFLLSLPTLSR